MLVGQVRGLNGRGGFLTRPSAKRIFHELQIKAFFVMSVVRTLCSTQVKVQPVAVSMALPLHAPDPSLVLPPKCHLKIVFTAASFLQFGTEVRSWNPDLSRATIPVHSIPSNQPIHPIELVRVWRGCLGLVPLFLECHELRFDWKESDISADFPLEERRVFLLCNSFFRLAC